mmetsp:Transcript_55577/g.146626  ORF Transcript_55577/g.146626 Transcript_55577/m.146626 type:complete len:200 (-) Transcript_55577:706-1305(-)
MAAWIGRHFRSRRRTAAQARDHQPAVAEERKGNRRLGGRILHQVGERMLPRKEKGLPPRGQTAATVQVLREGAARQPKKAPLGEQGLRLDRRRRRLHRRLLHKPGAGIFGMRAAGRKAGPMGRACSGKEEGGCSTGSSIVELPGSVRAWVARPTPTARGMKGPGSSVLVMVAGRSGSRVGVKVVSTNILESSRPTFRAE